MKFNIITHITTFCNYNCSYCDVIKNKKHFSKQNVEDLLIFIKNNKNNIERFKFFGGEPLLAWNNIRYIINNSSRVIGNNYEIVTNTTLLTNEIGEYFKIFFKIIFFSIDTENDFDYEIIEEFIKKFNLKDKVYFNLVISPGKEKESLKQFYKLYHGGFRGFNILPVYITKIWSTKNLKNLSQIMKEILDLSLKDKSLKLHGFQENLGEELKLSNNTIFIDIDSKIYYSDIVSTFFGSKVKTDLFLGEVKNLNLEKIINYNCEKKKKSISILEKNVYNKVKGQRELQKIMDYFSIYLNQQKYETGNY